MKFLTVITRVHPKRPNLVKKTIESIKNQSDDDIQHLLVYDPTENGIGFPGANDMIARAVGIEGDYVTVLDDDDIFSSKTFIADLKKLIEKRPIDLVIGKVRYGKNVLPPESEFKQEKIVLSKIGSTCAIVRRDLWDKNKEIWGVGVYCADFHFIAAVTEQAKASIWWDYLIAETLSKVQNNRGAEEGKIILSADDIQKRPIPQARTERRPMPPARTAQVVRRVDRHIDNQAMTVTQMMNLKRSKKNQAAVLQPTAIKRPNKPVMRVHSTEFTAEMAIVEKSIPVDYFLRECSSAKPMSVNIIIPTIGDRSRIYDTIDSALVSSKSDIAIKVIAQENRGAFDRLQLRYAQEKKIEIVWEPTNKGWVRVMNEAAARWPGALFYGADDIVFMRDCFAILEHVLQERFPDEDGVVVTHQSQTNLAWRQGFIGAFGLIGDKFLNRFPGRKFLCPDYWGQWSDAELRDVALHYGKLAQAWGAELMHFDPRPNERDQTSVNIYANTMTACADYIERRRRDWLWGKNYDRLCEQEYPRK